MEQNYSLPYLLEDDTISLSDTTKIVEKMKQSKALEKKYGDQIKFRKDGRQCYVLINRKQIVSSTLDGLYEKLWQLEYGRQNASLSDLYPEFMRWKRDSTGVSAQTLRHYRILWEDLLDNAPISKVPLVELKAKDFTVYFRSITKKRDITKKRFVNFKSLLNGIYAYAIEDEIVEYNPIRDVDSKQFAFKPVNNDNDVFTIEERNQLLAYLECDDGIYSLGIQLSFHLVIRIGELLALRFDDIDGSSVRIQGQYLSVVEMNDDLSFTRRECRNVDHVKGYADCGYRTQPLTPRALEILHKIRALNPDGEFILMMGRKQLNAETFNDKLKQFCRLAGVRPLSSHKIRFSSASILHQQGMPLPSLQKLLGHTTTAMTLHYLRSVETLEDTEKLMEKALG